MFRTPSSGVSRPRNPRNLRGDDDEEDDEQRKLNRHLKRQRGEDDTVEEEDEEDPNAPLGKLQPKRLFYTDEDVLGNIASMREEEDQVEEVVPLTQPMPVPVESPRPSTQPETQNPEELEEGEIPPSEPYFPIAG